MTPADSAKPITAVLKFGGEVVAGGMIPKIEEALRNLARGVGAIHILGAEPGSLLGEAGAPGSRGTALTLQ